MAEQVGFCQHQTMKLVLYSGGRRENYRIHRALTSLVSARKKVKRFTYIPYCAEGATLFYNRAVRRYRSFGFTHFQCLPVDEKITKAQLRQALSSDVIYLAGGNTFYFLFHLRKSGLLPQLKAFAKKGGILAGLSAGAIILTPNINLAGYPPFDADENEVGLTNMKSLGLVPFEIFPHYYSSPRLNLALETYSLNCPRPIYLIPDGCGIMMDGKKLRVLGKVYRLDQGIRTRLVEEISERRKERLRTQGSSRPVGGSKNSRSKKTR